MMVHHEDMFKESLTIKPLLDGKVLSHFQFDTAMMLDEKDQSASSHAFTHFKLFPKSLGQVIRKFGVREMHLSFTQGRWNYEKWGYPLVPTPVGAELFVWFDRTASTRTSVDSQWKGLVHALSGLFCASLNFLDISSPSYATGVVSNSPHSFRPWGDTNDTTNQAYFRYGTLSRETVCTENLTPFKKLLPSRGKDGISELLNPLKLYDANFHSMGIHFYPISRTQNGQTTTEFHLVQTVTVVFDLLVGAERREYSDWSLQTLFLRQSIRGPCVLADESKVIVEMAPQFISPSSGQKYSFSFNPEPSFELSGDASVDRPAQFVFDLIEMRHSGINRPFELQLSWGGHYPVPSRYESQSIVSSHRYQTGFGQLDGGFVVRLMNNHPTMALNVTYFDAIPWYVRVYFHTLRVALNGHPISPEKDFSMFHVMPAIERKTPSIFEFQTILPPLSTLIFTVEFDKVFLKYTEHPPDANRGFDLSPSIVTCSQIPSTRYYTESLIVSLPTPDFSMPYNVITLTCTVLSLFFGSLYNVLIRRFSGAVSKRDNSSPGQKDQSAISSSSSISERPSPSPKEGLIKRSVRSLIDGE